MNVIHVISSRLYLDRWTKIDGWSELINCWLGIGRFLHTEDTQDNILDSHYFIYSSSICGRLRTRQKKYFLSPIALFECHYDKLGYAAGWL